MPDTPRLLHLCLTVPDLDAAAEFYTNVLGFVAAPNRFTGSGPDADAASGYAARGEDGSHEGLFLNKGEFFLEIAQMADGEQGPERLPMKHYGLQLLAFHVRDLEHILTLVEQYGGRRIEDRGTSSESVSLVFCADPAGNVIELVHCSDETLAELAQSLHLGGLGWAGPAAG